MMSIPHHHKTYWRSVRWIACRGACRSPPKSAKRKRKEDTKRRQEATAHAGAQRPPPTGRLRGRVRESTPRPAWIHKQNSPQLDLGRSNANARSCWTIANAKPQLRRGRGRQRVRHPEPKQTRCQLTACFTSSLVWAGQAGPCICVWLENERTRTKINDTTLDSVTCQYMDQSSTSETRDSNARLVKVEHTRLTACNSTNKEILMVHDVNII